MRRTLMLAGVLAAVLVLSAATADSFDIRYLLAVLGLATLAVSIRGTWWLAGRGVEWLREFDRWRLRIDGALWGAEDWQGHRPDNGGLVGAVERLAAELPRQREDAALAREAAEEARRVTQDCRVYAATAADAAKQTQDLLIQHIRGAHPETD